MTSGFTREFALTAVLMATGAVLNAVATWTLLPPKEGADHEALFTRYADSGVWVAAHLVQFAGILVGLAGLFVLARALRHEGPHLAALAGAIPCVVARNESGPATTTVRIRAPE